MASTISPRLNGSKLNAAFSGKTVSHTAILSDLEARQRRIEVKTVWVTENRLGEGGFGVVWRQRSDTGHVRVVKIIPKGRLNIQEVEALIELRDHPDLFIRFLGWFEDPDRDTFHIAMEFIEHGHLGKYIAEYRKNVDTKTITSQILEGLVVLHERGICHRDLKPENILVASLSPIWVKITDFGISKRWLDTPSITHFAPTIYRAPEQMGLLPRKFRASGVSYTNHIDIWAIGAIVHQMLTLEIPFLDTNIDLDSDLESCFSTVEDTPDSILLYNYCRGADPFPCVSLRSHGVPEDGIEFVKSLMTVNPTERLSAAAALASKWLMQNEVPPATRISPVAGPSRLTLQSDAKMDPGPLPTDGRVSSPTKNGNDQDITIVRADDSPLAPVAELLTDQADDTTKAQRSYVSAKHKERRQIISQNRIDTAKKEKRRGMDSVADVDRGRLPADGRVSVPITSGNKHDITGVRAGPRRPSVPVKVTPSRVRRRPTMDRRRSQSISPDIFSGGRDSGIKEPAVDCTNERVKPYEVEWDRTSGLRVDEDPIVKALRELKDSFQRSTTAAPNQLQRRTEPKERPLKDKAEHQRRREARTTHRDCGFAPEREVENASRADRPPESVQSYYLGQGPGVNGEMQNEPYPTMQELANYRKGRVVAPQIATSRPDQPLDLPELTYIVPPYYSPPSGVTSPVITTFESGKDNDFDFWKIPTPLAPPTPTPLASPKRPGGWSEFVDGLRKSLWK